MISSTRDYVFGTVNDQPRLAEYHRLVKPFFLQQVEQLLDDEQTGLTQLLTAKKAANAKALFIDAGCAEGLYLHDLAEVLEKRQLLAASNLIGVDIDRTVIATAEDYKLAAKPPQPSLHFYAHNLALPLSSNPDLQSQIADGIDFLYALRVVSFIPNTRQVIKQLYEALNPGGLIYFLEFQMHAGEQGGWIAPTVTQPFFDNFGKLVRSLNNGVEVAGQLADWLKELGAEQVQSKNGTIRSNGDGSPESLQLLRLLVTTGRNVAPSLVASKLMTQAEADATMERIFQELDMQTVAQFTITNIVARKPLEK